MADAKKLLGGLGKVSEKLLASGDELTAAQRAEAGRKAAALIKSQPQVKASEALGQQMEKGVKRTTTTQSDRTRVGGGNIGGAPFSAISEADPAYKGKVWGVMDEGTAARLKNLTDDETAWTTMLGSASQLKTNPIVFDKLKRGFIDSMKQGNLSPELAGKINHNLALTFGEGADIRDPKIWREANTFEKRAALADVMMGQGTAPSKGGIAIGGEKSGKGVIFKPTDILKRETEPSLLHTEHGGDVPTFAAGPRLFKIEKESEYRPDLHPGYPTLLKGKDLGVNMMPTPTEIYLPDWHKRFKANNPERKGPGYYDLALGVKGEGLPSQDLNDEYIRHLLREGFKKGGKVEVDIDAADRRLSQAMAKRMSGGGMAKGGSVDIKSADARLQAAIDARMGMAEGGEAGFKKIQFMADGGKLVKGLSKIGKKLTAERDVLPTEQREENLQKFLGNSRIRDRLYHATPKDFTTFKAGGNDPTLSGPAIWLSPNAKSQPAAHNIGGGSRGFKEGTNVMPVYAQARSPLMLDDKFSIEWAREVYADGSREFPDLISPKTVEELKKGGYDSIIHADPYGNRGGEQEIIMFEPNKIKSAIGNRGTYDIEDADITKAEGGGAFKKLKFMADGGKLAKGAAQIGKRLMADNSLPALEREANLKKFLEPSKTPMRLYHGTTATEGGKRNEAIRRIKPSKEGALGSGVYMTPKPNYASNYALDHMTPESYASSMGDAFEAGNVLPVHAQIRNPLIIGDTGERIDPAAEALMKLGMDKEKAQMMVERLYEDKGNIGKQIQTRAQAQGYDGLMLYHTDGELGEVVSYHPSAVKSAIGNEGTYDIRQPDLSKAHGGLAMADGGKLVKGLGKVGKKLMADEAPKATAPAIPRSVSAGDTVNGMLVRKDIPNQSSIGASLYDYSTHGVQEVPMSAFETVGKPKYRSAQEEQYTKELARQIQENKELNPLIVVKDAKGHYILEGAHRFDALRELGIDSFPALMVHDLESLADVVAPVATKAEGGGAFKQLQFVNGYDGGGIAVPEMNNSFEGSRREPLLTEKDWANIKRNAPEVYDWAKQNVKDEASQLKTARGVKDFALRTGAQYLGGIPDLINLGLMGVDAVADTSLSSEKPWFGSEQYIDALKKSGAVGENEFPIAETVAGILAPAGLIKKGAKKLRNVRSKEEPKKRRGGLTAMSR